MRYATAEVNSITPSATYSTLSKGYNAEEMTISAYIPFSDSLIKLQQVDLSHFRRFTLSILDNLATSGTVTASPDIIAQVQDTQVFFEVKKFFLASFNKAVQESTPFVESNINLEQKNDNIAVLLKELGRLLREEEYDEDFLKPTDYSIRKAVELALTNTSAINATASAPKVSTDGFGGIRIEWRHGNKEVRTIIASNTKQQSYIYYEDPNSYALDPEITPSLVRKRLDWLAA